MYFTSYEFILFLLACMVLYYVIPKKFQWMFLLIASYTFYFINGVFYPIFLFTASVVTYGCGVLIENRKNRDGAYLKEHREEFDREQRKAFQAKSNKAKKRYMLLGVLICIAILAVFKYSDFVIDNINKISVAFGGEGSLSAWNLILPLGISFYTFQSIGYLLDVYYEKISAERNLFKHMLFVSFFPQLIQGPISRYSDVADSMFAEHRFEWNKVRFGIERIIWGFFKKLVVADTIVPAVTAISKSPEYYTGAWVLVGIIFYAFQLYADFSGGIDITIGVAEVFGITLPENFERPFFSKSIAEYWRRWHITMGTWFRDYIFYPMSISPGMGRLSKKAKNRFGKGFAKRVTIYSVTMVTWLATGIWHGADWIYVVWGLMNGVILIISEELNPLYEKFHKKFPRFSACLGYRIFQMIRTFLLMGCLRMSDCYRSVGRSFKMFISMFKDFSFSALSGGEFLELGITATGYLTIAIGIMIIWIVSIMGPAGSVREKLAKLPYLCRFGIFICLLLVVILFGTYGYGFDSVQFIYNQF